MARIRTIKPDFWRNRRMASVSELARLLAIALLNAADDHGYFEADCYLIRGEVFPYMEDPLRIQGALTELSGIGYVVLREASSGRQLGFIPGFKDHQVVNKPSKSRLKDDFEKTSTKHDVFPHSRSTTVVVSEGSGLEMEMEKEVEVEVEKEVEKDLGNELPKTPTPTKSKQSSVQSNPPSADDVRRYMADQGYADDADAFVDFYTSNGWVQGRGKPIKDWQAAVRNWQRSPFRLDKPKTFAQQREENTVQAALNWKAPGMEIEHEPQN
jgi:hypothetical protein